MAVIKTVTSGQPITAGWANSLVHEVNTHEGLRLRGKTTNSTSLRPVRIDNHPAWQVSFSRGTYVINGGQLYINGLLVGQEQEVCSFNMFCSATNYQEKKIYNATSSTDIPCFWLQVGYTTPIDELTIKEVTCELVVTTENKEPELPEVTENPENEQTTVYKNIQLTAEKNGRLVQLISGSIYLTTYEETEQVNYSFIAGDGINILEQQDTYTVTDKNGNIITKEQTTVTISASVITNSDVVVQAGENITVNESVNNNTKIYTVNAIIPEIPDIPDHECVSIIQGDGITVDYDNNGKVYTISSAVSAITYDFDENWFIVTSSGTNTSVTLNTDKLNEVINEAVNELTVDIQVNGLLEHTDNSTGKLMANSSGTLTLDTNVSY